MSSSNIQSVQKTSSVKAVDGRTRLLGVYFSHTATPATLTLKNGSNSGAAKLTMTTDITSVTLLFEGGAAA
jgi:hypothetical protein